MPDPPQLIQTSTVSKNKAANALNVLVVFIFPSIINVFWQILSAGLFWMVVFVPNATLDMSSLLASASTIAIIRSSFPSVNGTKTKLECAANALIGIIYQLDNANQFPLLVVIMIIPTECVFPVFLSPSIYRGENAFSY